MFDIDRVPAPLPDTIDVMPPEAAEIKLPGGQRHYIEDLSGVDVEAVFGMGALLPEDLRQLEIMRGSQGLHMITFNNISCDDLVDLLVYMPKVPHTRLSQRANEDFAYAPTTLVFHQVNTAYQMVLFEWWFYESAGYSVGDAKWRITMPASGKFINTDFLGTQYGVRGWFFQEAIDSIGGSGSIEFQIRNSTQGLDYLTTPGEFAASDNSLDSGGEFIDDAEFIKGDIVDLDIDAIIAGTPTSGIAIFVVQAWAFIH